MPGTLAIQAPSSLFAWGRPASLRTGELKRRNATAAAAQTAPANPVLAAKYLALNLLGDFQLPETRSQVAELSRTYHDALPSSEKAKIRAQLIMLHMESMASALGQTRADDTRTGVVTASVGNTGPVRQTPNQPASWNLQPSRPIELNGQTSPTLQRTPSASVPVLIKRKRRPNILKAARERLEVARDQVEEYLGNAIQGAVDSTRRLARGISIRYSSIRDDIRAAARARGWNRNKPWLETPGMTVAVAGWEIPGGVLLDDGPKQTAPSFSPTISSKIPACPSPKAPNRPRSGPTAIGAPGRKTPAAAAAADAIT